MHFLPLVLPILKIKKVKALLSQNTFSRQYEKIILNFCVVDNVLPILQQHGNTVRKLVCNGINTDKLGAVLSKLPKLQQIWFHEVGFKQPANEIVIADRLQEVKKVVISESSLSVSNFFL